MAKWRKEEYSLSKDFTLLLLDTLEDLGLNKAKTQDEKAFILELTEYMFLTLKNNHKIS